MKIVAQGLALVEYDELMDEVDSSRRLQEWFRLPGTSPSESPVLPSDALYSLEAGDIMRPAPPPQVRHALSRRILGP